MARYQLVLFDLDGTLVDSVPDLAAAVDATMTHYQLPPPGLELVKQWIGNGSRHLIQRALATTRWCGAPELSEHTIEQVHQYFLQCYEQQFCVYTRLFDGVVATLAQLQQARLPMAVVTNKPQQFVPPLLQHLNIDRYFSLTIGGDSLTQKKPHPLPLLHCCEFFGIKPLHTLMVGDSIHDVQAAQAAGIDVAAVNYGYNHGQDIGLANPNYVLNSFSELNAVLRD